MHAEDTYTGNLHYTMKSKIWQSKVSWWDQGWAGKPAQKPFVMLVSLLIGPPSNKEFVVEISGTTVTIRCPSSKDPILWELSGVKQDNKEQNYVIENHDSSPVNVSCSAGGEKYEMYLNARGE